MKNQSSSAMMLPLMCLSLAACGGSSSSTPPTSLPETNITSRNLAATNDAANIGVAFSDTADMVTITVDGVDLPDVARRAVVDNGSVLGYADFSQGIEGFAVVTDDSVASAFQRGGFLTPTFSGAVFQRLTNTEIPDTGVANYTGDYAGYLRQTEDATAQVFRLVNGEVSLMANFESGEISGEITNRVSRFNGGNQIDPNNPLADVTLELTTLDAQGGFAGSATGGQLLRGGDDTTLATSRYGGLISGGDALDEVVGAVVIDHSCCTDEAITEVGIFLVE